MDDILYFNGIVITWILHQISMYSNKVKLVAGYKNDSPHSTPLSNTLPFYLIYKIDEIFSLVKVSTYIVHPLQYGQYLSHISRSPFRQQSCTVRNCFIRTLKLLAVSKLFLQLFLSKERLILIQYGFETD